MKKKEKIQMEKLTFPSTNKISHQFIVTLIGILFLIAFFILADLALAEALKRIYI